MKWRSQSYAKWLMTNIPPHFLTLIFFERMLHFAGHEWIRVLLKDAQAGASTEINALAMIHGAGIIGRVSENTSAGSFIFW